MADSAKLAEVVAMLTERDQEFRPIQQAANGYDETTGEQFWSLGDLARALQIENPRRLAVAANKAKIAAGKADVTISEHFSDGSLFGDPDEMYLSKYAAYLVVMNCDPRIGLVGKAQVYFALQIDRQLLEDEKRLHTRLEVATEQNKLHGVAQDKGVENFGKFNGMGIQGLYGGRTAAQVKAEKGLSSKDNHLDFAGSEELAANLFRITQTRAALARQGHKSEQLACSTHKSVGQRIRNTIIDAGNTPPEKLPVAELKIDRLATKKKKALGKK